MLFSFTARNKECEAYLGVEQPLVQPETGRHRQKIKILHRPNVLKTLLILNFENYCTKILYFLNLKNTILISNYLY